jgi:hypothetical protein
MRVWRSGWGAFVGSCSSGEGEGEGDLGSGAVMFGSRVAEAGIGRVSFSSGLIWEWALSLA